MKSLVLALALVSASQVFASTQDVKAEAKRIANVILDNPDAAAQLDQAMVNIVDYSIVEDGKGVNTFTFEVDRTCFCMPKPGTLTVIQDLRPTFADGPIKYSFDITWKK